MDLFKVLNIGLNTAQAVQLTRMRGQMAEMGEAQMLAQYEQEVLSALKNLIFATSKSARALQPHLNATPQPVYVGGRLLQWRLQEMGVTPEIFEDFKDKEYVLETEQAIGQVISDSSGRLSPSELKQAEACVNAIVELPELEAALETARAQSLSRRLKARFETFADEWRVLHKAKNRYRLLSLGLMGGGAFLLVFLVFPLSLATLAVPEFGTFLCCGSSGLLAVGGIGFGGYFWQTKQASERYKELERERQALLTQQPKKEILERKSEKFGGYSLAELELKMEKRQALISQVMGQMEDDEALDQFMLSGEF